MKIDYDQVHEYINKETSNFIDKLHYYLGKYLEREKETYTTKDLEFIRESFNALCLKHTYFTYATGSLWAMSEHKRNQISYPKNISLESSQLSQSELLFYCTTFELAIYEARSLIEFTMNFCSKVMKYQKQIIGLGEFKSKWKSSVKSPFTEKADILWSYFNDEVFGDGMWGHDLKSIRDKITHKTIIKMNHEGREHILNIRLNWPTIKEETYERFIQEQVANNIHCMTIRVYEILLEIKWQAGMLSEIVNSSK